MSNYTKSTNFATKDNLTPGDPLKVVRGTEIDTEYNNIATAIATKTDNASAAITGGSITGITDLAIADGGTGASTATAAINNLLPAQTSAANKYLQSDGTNVSWDAVTLSTADITGTLPVANGGTGVTSSTGTGSVVLSNSPTLVTPALGTPASGVATNLTGLPISTGVSGLGTGVATFLATPSSANLASAVTDETGSGALVFANSPSLVTPALGTPASATLTNATGLPVSTGISGLGTGVATFLATPSSANLRSALTDETGTGSAVFATSPALVTPDLGTPSAATLTNATGLPIATGVSGLGTGVATFLATPSSANLASALTDETGTGSAVFATSPTLVTPALGSPSSVGTMPAFTLGGTVSGGGNQINNVIIGTSTPLAGAFTTLSATGTSTLAAVKATSLGVTSTRSADQANTTFLEFSSGGIIRVEGADASSYAGFSIILANSAGGTGYTPLSISNTGNSTFSGNISVGGAAVTTSGTGITFPATQSASSNANTLDDYEEGTWTPSVGGTATYYTQNGTYTKIGNIYYIRANMHINLIGTGSTTVISDLPFSASADDAINPSYFGDLDSSVYWFNFYTNSGTQLLNRGQTALDGTVNSGLTLFKNGTQVVFSGVIRVS